MSTLDSVQDIEFRPKGDMHPIPDFCNSLRCDSLGCRYCRDCSHAFFQHAKWVYNPRTGPEFRVKPTQAVLGELDEWLYEKRIVDNGISF